MSLDKYDDDEDTEELPFFFATVNMLSTPNDQETFKAKWKNDSAPLWSYILYWLIYAGFFIAGLVSVGLLWPTVIRRDVFGSFKKKKSPKRDILDQVETVEKRLQNLDSKIHLLQQQFQDGAKEMQTMDSKIDQLRQQSQDGAKEADIIMLGITEKIDLMLLQISKLAKSKP